MAPIMVFNVGGKPTSVKDMDDAMLLEQRASIMSAFRHRNQFALVGKGALSAFPLLILIAFLSKAPISADLEQLPFYLLATLVMYALLLYFMDAQIGAFYRRQKRIAAYLEMQLDAIEAELDTRALRANTTIRGWWSMLIDELRMQ